MPYSNYAGPQISTLRLGVLSLALRNFGKCFWGLDFGFRVSGLRVLGFWIIGSRVRKWFGA